MIHSIQIQGYRRFQNFSMDALTRINLLVGANNCGKTSVLEAIYLLEAGTDLTGLWSILSRRGEVIIDDKLRSQRPEKNLDLCHLFFHHEIKNGTTFSIQTTNQSPPRSITYKILEAERKNLQQTQLPIPIENEDSFPSKLALSITANAESAGGPIPLTRLNAINWRYQNLFPQKPIDATNIQYITTESLSIDELTSMWNSLSLTKEEELVIEALQYLEEKITRIAVESNFNFIHARRGGFKVKLKGSDQPVPIGSLGDGIWRMLALAIALVQAKDGILLIDEIDTGLHFSIMNDMWSFVKNTAEKFNVQVFATTHSGDCERALASICSPGVENDNQVSLHRIEVSGEKAISYTENEILLAVKHNIETR